MSGDGSQKKIFIVDTNVFIDEPDGMIKFDDHVVVIPFWTIDELDGLKRDEEVGHNAREASRNIDELGGARDLKSGVTTKTGSMVVVSRGYGEGEKEPRELQDTRFHDDKIIALAKIWKRYNPGMYVAIVSKDRNLRVKANYFGVPAEDYRGKNGHAPVILPPAEIHLTDQSLITRLCQSGAVLADDIAAAALHPFSPLTPNQCCYVYYGNKYQLAIYKAKEKVFRHVPKPHKDDVKKKIAPRNNEQAFALALATDPSIKVVALAGTAGSGKTLMALLGAAKQTFECEPEAAEYAEILIYRPNIEIGEPLGFLKGDLVEKFEPWTLPIIDNLRLILEEKQQQGNGKKREAHTQVKELIDDQIIVISPINHIQGRSLHDKFVIVDEAQNLTPLQAKMVVTRLAKGSKLLFTGDIEQVSNPYLNSRFNGLYHLISRSLGQDIFGYVAMNRSEERGEIAKLGAELL